MTNETKRRLAKTTVIPSCDVELQATYCHRDYTHYAIAAHEVRVAKAPPVTIAELRAGGRRTRTDWPVVTE